MGDSILQTAVREFLVEMVRDKLRVSGIHIDGVEVTQAIQYRSAELHLTDPADRGPDNSIRLVADKPAKVRVYVRHFGTTVYGVTGTVMLQRKRYGIWVDAGALTQQWPPSVTAEPAPDYPTERRASGSSLNFIIPAATMRGHLRLKVQISVPGDARTDDTVVDINATLLQTLRVRGIPVQYFGPDAAGNQVRLPPTTLADFQATVGTALRMYPVSQTPEISLAGAMTWSEPLNGPIIGGQCPVAWIDLLFWVSLARVFDGNRADALYYALLPVGIPIGGAAGCGGPGAGAGSGVSGDGMTMAHELGHVLGFSHAPCGLGAGAASDPNYPAYEPYDSAGNGRRASIGEYGLDVTLGTIYPPDAGKDYMSYCGPGWVSLYHYKALLEHPRLNPTLVSEPRDGLPPYLDEQYHGPSVFDRPDPPPPYVGRRAQLLADPDPVRLVVVTGLLRGEDIEVRSLVRIETGPTPIGASIPGTFVDMLDGNGRVLQRVALRHMSLLACACGEGCSGSCSGGEGDVPRSGLVQAMLPDVEGSAVLRVIRDGEEIWSRQATSEAPSIDNVRAEIEGCSLRVSWQSSASDAYPIERFVRWSADDGHHWHGLAVKLDKDEAVVPTHGLTSGAVLIQVTVSDGFHSTNSDPVRVEVPNCPSRTTILWPVQGAYVRFDEHVRLWGTASASDGSTLPDDALCWYLDGEAVGRGPELWVALPEWEGEHRATLKVGDGHQHMESSVVFMTSCSGRRPYRSRDSRSSRTN